MLSNNISQSNTGIQQSKNPAPTSSVNPGSSQPANSTAGLEKGQLIRGEITDLRSNEVSVKLEDGRVLSGKLEDSKNLAIGDKVVFRVEDVSLKSLTLKIISNTDFTSGENTAEKALEAAGFGKNSHNMSIVRELLNQQMSIDKKTISLLIKQSVLHKETSVQTLVLMNKYHLPVNEANISQFTAYQNSEHSILNNIGTLADSIADFFTPSGDVAYPEYLTRSTRFLNLLLNRSGDAAAGTSPNPADIKTPDPLMTDLPVSNLTDVSSFAAGGTDGNVIRLATGSFLSQADALELVQILKSDSITESLLNQKFLSALSEGSADLGEAAQTLTRLLNDPVSASLSSEMKAALANSPAAGAILSANEEFLQAGRETGLYLNLQDRINLVNVLDSFYHSGNSPLSSGSESFPELKNRIMAGNLSSEEILNWVQDNLNKADEASAKTLLSSKEFKLLIKDDLLNKWTMDPKTLTGNEDVNRHFESLLHQINGLKEYMEQSLPGNTNIPGQVSQLHENISFMNDLNQFFTYFQLPLKLRNQFANSELYVYSRKKPGRTAEEGISVLLHLDMEHLGPLDVFLDLHEKHLVSRFYLDTPDVMELIGSHINKLEEILTEKGYTLNTEILKREKAVNIVDDFLKEDPQPASVTRYNFDLRA